MPIAESMVTSMLVNGPPPSSVREVDIGGVNIGGGGVGGGSINVYPKMNIQRCISKDEYPTVDNHLWIITYGYTLM